MSGRLYFDLAEALRIGEATMHGEEHTDSFSDQMDGTKTGPALMWVKDAGTYLMSNAIPRVEGEVLYGRAYTHNGLLLQQPDDSRTPGWDEVWHTTRGICGGDDFAEYFGLEDLLPALREGVAQGGTHLVLIVADEAIEIGIERHQ